MSEGKDLGATDFRKRWQGERGRRIAAEAKVKELRELTQDKRDFLALLDQAEAEIQRLESQSGDYWKNMYEDQLRRKRALHERYVSLRDHAVNLIEDVEIAAVIRERDRTDTGERLTIDELVAELGLTLVPGLAGGLSQTASARTRTQEGSPQDGS